LQAGLEAFLAGFDAIAFDLATTAIIACHWTIVADKWQEVIRMWVDRRRGWHF
jgi:hypothetical protein